MTTDQRHRMLLVAGFSSYLVTLGAVAPPAGAVLALAAQLSFVLPGVWLVARLRQVDSGWLVPLAFGPLLGQGLSTLALVALWAAGLRDAWIIGIAPLLVWLLFRALPSGRGRWRLPATKPQDVVALLCLLLIVPVIVAAPFANVGAMTGEGQAYRAYFTADYVWRRAVVLELAKGDFLPVNPYYLSDVLHYYWLPHLLPAVAYRSVGSWLSLDAILLTHSIVIDGFFVTFLYGVARVFRIRPWPATAGIGAVLLFSSFEGAYAIWDLYATGRPMSALRVLNIDAISRWFLGSMPIDGLHRVLWYQPHHATGYALGLLGVLAVSQRLRRADPLSFAVGGALLGMATLISSFAGLMFTAIAAVTEGVFLLRTREWRRAVIHVMAASIPLGIAASLVMVMKYVDTGESIISLGLNPVAAHRVVAATFLSFGPVLLLGAAGAVVAFRQRRIGQGMLVPYVVTCLAFYFFVDIRDHQDVYVGWRVGHLLFIVAPLLFGVLFEQVAGWSGRRRAGSLLAIALVLALAAPTTLIDVFNTQDISNRERGPGFRWTLMLSPDDLQVFDWIRHNTRADAIFQIDPVARGADTWAYLPAFAARRMSAGLPISMVPLKKYEEASARIAAAYDEAPLSAYERFVLAGIGYLIVGPPERQAHVGVETRLDSLPQLMPLAFRNGTISIYEIKPGR